MRQIKLRGIIMAALILIGGMSAIPVRAASEGEANLTVDKTFVDFGFAKETGRSYTSEFKLMNIGEGVAKIELRAEKYEEDCAEESRRGVDWLAFVDGKNYFEIPGGEEATVKIRYSIPKDAERDRSQYAVVEAVMDDVVRSKVITKISIVGENDERSYGGKINDIKADFVSLGRNLEGAAEIENAGKIGFETAMRVRMSPAFGLEKWQEVYEGSTELAPGAKVNFGYQADGVGYGVFKIEQIVSYVNKDGKAVTMTNLRRAVIIPIWFLFVIVGIILLIILIAVGIKKAKKKKAQTETVPEDMAAQDGVEE